MDDTEAWVNYVLAGVPPDIREDCKQAAYLALWSAEKKRASIESFKAYAIRSMKNEVLSEIAKLKGPGHGAWSLDKKTFLAYNKFKSTVDKNGDVDSLELSDSRADAFGRMYQLQRKYEDKTPILW
jgi:DNA-directed RNA polymerase specialized sigma24 family protein